MSVLTDLLCAAALGFGTIFQPQARRDAHWSTSPKAALVVQFEIDDGLPWNEGALAA